MNSNGETSQAHLSDQLWSKINFKTKPLGALGQIENLAHQIGMIQGTDCPQLQTCQLIIFSADHGLAAAGVSAYPQDVTRQMVLNFLHGGAAANIFANTVGVSVSVVDAGVAGDPIEHPDLISRRISSGTSNSMTGPAMTTDQRDEALSIGKDLGASTEADAVCVGEMGIGNTSAASLITHKVLGLPLDDVIGRGTGVDEDGLAKKREVLTKAAARTSNRLGASEALSEYGGFEIVMAAGAMIGAAKARKLVLVDGFISTAAAVAALDIEPDIRSNLVFAHCSAESGHAHVLKAISADPLLDLEMRLGEGTGALLAWPICQAAVGMLNDMASFESAGVSGPE